MRVACNKCGSMELVEFKVCHRCIDELEGKLAEAQSLISKVITMQKKGYFVMGSEITSEIEVWLKGTKYRTDILKGGGE